jgi:hypothetical protein
MPRPVFFMVVYLFFNLIPPTPFSSLEKGEKTHFMGGFEVPSPLWRGDLGVRLVC